MRDGRDDVIARARTSRNASAATTSKRDHRIVIWKDRDIDLDAAAQRQGDRTDFVRKVAPTRDTKNRAEKRQNESHPA
jgi:hypothetical protein